MNIPGRETFNVAVTNGTLNINFLSGSVENPKVNGIEVLQSTLLTDVDSHCHCESLPTGTLALRIPPLFRPPAGLFPTLGVSSAGHCQTVSH